VTASTPADSDRRVSVLLERAEALAAEHRLADAKAAFLTAIRCDSGHTARNEYGRFLTRTESYDEAVEQFSILLTQAKATGDEQLRSTATNNLAAVYRELGCPDIAARLQQQAIAAEMATGEDTYPTSCVLANRANDAILAGDFHLARCLLRRSLALEVEAKSLAGQAADWGSLGVIAGLEGNTGEAIGCLRRAYQLHQRLSDAHGAGCDLMNLAETFRTIGRWRAASRCYLRAMRRFEQAGSPQSIQRAQAQRDETERLAAVLRRDVSLN
jgi:tetratricopeptide (TPR) repeat protein